MMGNLNGNRCEMGRKWVIERSWEATGDSHSNRTQRPRFWSWGCRGALTLISLATTLAKVTCRAVFASLPHVPLQPFARTGGHNLENSNFQNQM